MSNPTASRTGRRASRKEEPVDSYPDIREPRQSHAGNALAMLSVFAILAFGIWTAIGTFTGPADKSAAKPQVVSTAAPTKAPVVAVAPTGTAAAKATPSTAAASPGATPSRAATAGPGGTRVHIVGAGDTLYKIAQLYGTTVDAIMAANGFKDRSHILHVGDKLNIP